MAPRHYSLTKFVCLMRSAELRSAVCYIPAAETSIWTITAAKTKPDLILLASTLGLNSAKTNLMISMYSYDAVNGNAHQEQAVQFTAPQRASRFKPIRK